MGESVTARLDDLSFGMSRGRSFFVGFFFLFCFQSLLCCFWEYVCFLFFWCDKIIKLAGLSPCGTGGTCWFSKLNACLLGLQLVSALVGRCRPTRYRCAGSLRFFFFFFFSFSSKC